MVRFKLDLYIEGKQLELDDKFDFSLIFKSSVFTELIDETGNLKIDYNSVKPRICTIEFKEDTNTPCAYFLSELFFNELISQYYSKYQKIVLHPKIIQCQFLLTDIDIYTLDVMNPVYLEQTGNYYIIQELTVNKNNVAKAKLIQM